MSATGRLKKVFLTLIVAFLLIAGAAGGYVFYSWNPIGVETQNEAGQKRHVAIYTSFYHEDLDAFVTPPVPLIHSVDSFACGDNQNKPTGEVQFANEHDKTVSVPPRVESLAKTITEEIDHCIHRLYVAKVGETYYGAAHLNVNLHDPVYIYRQIPGEQAEYLNSFELKPGETITSINPLQ